jgi:hypothetical protein
VFDLWLVRSLTPTSLLTPLAPDDWRAFGTDEEEHRSASHASEERAEDADVGAGASADDGVDDGAGYFRQADTGDGTGEEVGNQLPCDVVL